MPATSAMAAVTTPVRDHGSSTTIMSSGGRQVVSAVVV
jgi:hypothetical protein